MPDSNKWKTRLLSSSVPMEYDVAKLLVSNGFSVDSEFSYSRNDAGVMKDFSVDLSATNYVSKTPDHLQATINLLIECKYRHQNNKWLFFEDVNDEDMSSFTLGDTIRAVDEFSWQLLPKNCTASFDETNIFCMKGIEIDTANGNVYDSEIQHGLKQLQFALPSLITKLINHDIRNTPEENLPFFYCPILLTTSEILVASRETSIKTIIESKNLEDFTHTKPWVIVYSEITPEFIKHRQTECSLLSEIAKLDFIKDIDTERKLKGEFDFRLPSNRCNALSDSYTPFPNLFSQTIICTLDNFPSLLNEIKKTTDLACSALL